MRVTKRKQSLHLAAASYLIESYYFSYENLRSVVLSQVGHPTIQCRRQLGGLAVPCDVSANGGIRLPLPAVQILHLFYRAQDRSG